MAVSPTMERLHDMAATSAIHDGQRDIEDYTGWCHTGTREKYLNDLMEWAGKVPDAKGTERVVLITARTGTGKTALLRSFCNILENSGTPVADFASFFVWKNDTRRNTLKHFPATIAAQLCRVIPGLIPSIERAVGQDPFLLKSTFQKQMKRLVIDPLLNLSGKIDRHLIIVVDGLDELDPSGRQELLYFIPHFLSSLPSLPISLLLSSRPEIELIGAFRHPRLASITKSILLGESDADIWKYIIDKVEDINLQFPQLEQEEGGMWPSQEKREAIAKQSSGLFLWPVVAIEHINKIGEGKSHKDRLENVLSATSVDPATHYMRYKLSLKYWHHSHHDPRDSRAIVEQPASELPP